MSTLPASIRAFVAQQTTASRQEVTNGEFDAEPSPTAGWGYRAALCLLLTGRIRATTNKLPNRTDVERLCKEVNFNQYRCLNCGHFFRATGVIQVKEHRGVFVPGPNLPRYWAHDVPWLQSASRQAFPVMVGDLIGGTSSSQSADPCSVHLTEFVILFHRAFQGLVVPEESLGSLMRSFADLPLADLARLAKEQDLPIGPKECAEWSRWLNVKREQAIRSALYVLGWAYVTEHAGKRWLLPSAQGLAMLGLGPVPEAAPLSTNLYVLPSLTVYAGAGLKVEQLLPLFRHCVVRRLDNVMEFQIDEQKLAEAGARSNPEEELRPVLESVGPLPPNVASLLATRTKMGGTLQVRACNALVKPPTPEVLEAIRKHPRLKGYLEKGAPPGYLLTKAGSSLATFMERCQELGFQIDFK